jgi:4-hydroxy-3-polyprenylbenzoate decarboxylase
MYRSLKNAVDDLQRSRQLVRIDEPVDARLEAAEIHRRTYQAGGPAVYFANVVGCQFPMVSNLFGKLDRARFLFRHTIRRVRRMIEARIDPSEALRRPWRSFDLVRGAWTMRPKRCGSGPVLECQTTIDQLPQLISWPDDGGPFVTLPQVYTEHVDQPGGLKHSNLGMYRVQLAGNEYAPNRQIGLHYQIHRGIGVHHQAALRRGTPLRVNIFVGGPPAMNLAAVMPLPEGMSELGFAGALAGRRIRMISRPNELPIHADADFCIVGTVDPEKLLPEGPFGDHLGYYSLRHDFPVLNVERVYHRRDSIWPFTVVGRPPQEDTVFGELIHELTGPIIPTIVPGVRAVHAVDATGVHPLLLAIGSERYAPYMNDSRPQELLTQANALLGQGQLSLAKYLWIADGGDDPALDIHDVAAFFQHMLRRVDWRRDLHFQTSTTIDTLDYSGGKLNEGSKLVVAARGPVVRELPSEVSGALALPDGFGDVRLAMPGVLAIRGPKATANDGAVERFCENFDADHPLNRYPLVVIVDDAAFAAASLSNFLWTTFTRSNPAVDVHGIASSVDNKHWGCRGSLVIDARIKPHHAPPLVADAEVSRRVDRFFERGGPLHGVE